MLADIPPSLVLAHMASIKLSRSKMKSDSSHSKDSKPEKLNSYSSKAEISTHLNFSLRIFICGLSRRKHRGSAHLQKERQDIETDEDKCDESCCAVFNSFVSFYLWEQARSPPTYEAPK